MSAPQKENQSLVNGQTIMTSPIDQVKRHVHIGNTSSVFWAGMRLACSRALADGETFVAILRRGGGLADPLMLTESERTRAFRYRRSSDSLNFVLGRTLMRHLLSSGTPMAFPPVIISPYGKPYIEGATDFNLSHAGSYVAFAICPKGPVGIDVETCDALDLWRQLLLQVAHPTELSVLNAGASVGMPQLFRRLWTRKEALLKGWGVGLSEDMRTINSHLEQECPLVRGATPLRVIDVLEDVDVSVSVAVQPCVRRIRVALIDGMDE